MTDSHKHNHLSKEEYKLQFQSAITYEIYLKNFAAEIAQGDQSEFAEYLPQNWRRQSRLDRKLALGEDLKASLKEITELQNWLVITEHWCGDASQINPLIVKAASENQENINLKFTYRDKNEKLIDAHLTDGRSRSIPILIKLDKDYNFIKAYGPRPAEAQRLVKRLLEKGEPYNIPLHTWYAKDKQKALQDDLITFIS